MFTLTFYGSSLYTPDTVPEEEKDLYNFDPSEYEKNNVHVQPTCIINDETIFYGIADNEILFEVCRLISHFSDDEILRFIAKTGFNY